MFDLIDHLQHTLEPRIAWRLRDNFQLLQRQAEHLVPTLAWVFFAELRWVLLRPADHPILMAGLVAFLTDRDAQGDPVPYPPEVMLGMGMAVLEARRPVVVQILGATVGLSEETATQVINMVLPELMHELQAQVRQRGLEELLTQLLAEHPGIGPERRIVLVNTVLALSAKVSGTRYSANA